MNKKFCPLFKDNWGQPEYCDTRCAWYMHGEEADGCAFPVLAAELRRCYNGLAAIEDSIDALTTVLKP